MKQAQQEINYKALKRGQISLDTYKKKYNKPVVTSIQVDVKEYDTPNEMIHDLEQHWCSDECMVEKRKSKGLPEIDNCPPIQDATPEEQEVTLSTYVYNILNSAYSKNQEFKKSIWYNIWKFFN